MCHAVTAGDRLRARGDVAVYVSVRVNHVVADLCECFRPIRDVCSRTLNSTLLIWVSQIQQVFKVIWHQAASPTCHGVTPRGCEWICPILTPSNKVFFGPTWVSPQTASRSVQPFLHSTSVWPTQTDTQTTHRATSVAIGHACRRCGLIMPSFTSPSDRRGPIIIVL